MKAFPRDIDIVNLKERHIGIENELAVGVNTNRGNLTLESNEIVKKHGFLQSVGEDGGGREFRTNPISIKSLHQVRGYKYLCEYYDTLKKETRVIDSGGTHLHISILNNDHVNMESNATAIATAFFNQFVKIAGRESHWAYRLGCRDIDAVHATLYRSTWGNLNRTYDRMSSMLNPTMHQTLEFRGPKGSNDKDEILAWAEFLENIVKVSNRDSVDGIKFKDLLVGDRISAYVKKLKMGRRITKLDLNKTLNVLNLQA